MTVENSAPVTETTQVDAGQAETTSSGETAGAVSATPSGDEASKAQDGLNPHETSVAPPVYTPNLKFRANQRELEFDKLFHSLIKDQDTEKKIRELHEKAYGLDTIKPERDHYKQTYNELQQKHSQLETGINKLSYMVEKKDFESFFQALGIPKSDIMQYAMLQLQLKDASPEQRQAYEAQRQESLRAYELQQENARLSQDAQNYAVALRTQELDLAMQRPEVSGIMQSFDQRVGRIGAFRDEVIKRGQLYAAQNEDISVDQAISEVIALLGVNVQQQMQAAPQVQAQQMTQSPAPQQRKPVIPNIQGRGTSPAKKVYKSLDDLKEYAKQRISSEGHTA